MWLSTFGDNTIREKMSFYSTNAGSIVAMGILMIPFLVVFQMIMQGRLSRDNKPKFVKTMAVMFCFQLTISAFTPQIIALYQDAGNGVADFVINAKDSDNIKIVTE